MNMKYDFRFFLINVVMGKWIDTPKMWEVPVYWTWLGYACEVRLLSLIGSPAIFSTKEEIALVWAHLKFSQKV